MLYDPLGAPGGGTFSPPGGTIYFNRTDVKKAINAPVDFNWVECANQNVYNTSTGSSVDAANWDYSSTSVLPGVIERSKRTIIGHGNLDAVLLKNGTLLSIQNMTWNGMQGFQQPITDDFFVPAHIDYQQTTLAASGVMGKTHEERGLIFVDINLAGHMSKCFA
jgi:carboxypeptidase D